MPSPSYTPSWKQMSISLSGNCWFLASIGALTFQDSILRQVVPHQTFNEEYCGIFHFRVHQPPCHLYILNNNPSHLMIYCYLIIYIISFHNYSVLEVWKMGGCCHWWQTTNYRWQTDLCPLHRPNWVMACFAGESLCEVWKNNVMFLIPEMHFLWSRYV